MTRRIDADLTRRGFVAGMAASVAAMGLSKPALAQAAPPPPRPILFTNVRLFDGKSASLREGVSLLVEAGRIKDIANGAPAAPDGARVIDGKGRVLMPGLIDMHWHAMFAALSIPALMTADIGYVHLAAAAEAEQTLLRGFTTIRDLGGPSFALKQVIDEGLAAGPRIYPCGAMITGSGGHADLRAVGELPRAAGTPGTAEQTGGMAIADGADEVRLRVREQMLQGASQIKIVGGGGVSSPRSPLDATTFSEPEVRAAAETAADWGTYIAVHAYASPTVQRAIMAGAACIEHGHLMDDATAALLAERGLWLSTQPFVGDDDSVPLTGPSRAKQIQVFAGTDNVYRLARKYGIRTAFGSDLLFSARLARRQGTMLTHLARWYSAAEALTMATATNGELLALSGPRNPYPGRLGVLEKDAFADMILVDGDPLADLALVGDPEKNFVLIMKDGKIYKDRVG